MPAHQPDPRSVPAALPRVLPWLLLLFLGSGCSALIWEIAWFQLLQFVVGSSAVSLGLLLGTFMGGMGLGSLLLPRLISPRRHPLRVYAGLEAGIAACGLLILYGLPALDRFYASAAGSGLTGILVRGLVCAACLVPPTLLMGATLPAIARGLAGTPGFVSWLGVFYGGNIAGAVFGCLLAGFYLLRVHDLPTACLTAALINGAVALAALVLASLAPRPTALPRPAADLGPGLPGSWAVYLTIALSGFCALGAEVVWTRLLSLLLGPTVYAFSIILAVFLLGLGLGSSLGSVLAGRTARPRLALGLCQLLLAAAVCWTALVLGRSLPYWPINPYLSSSPWFNVQLDLVRCLWAVLPPTVLWGASFPLALAGLAGSGREPGRLVGGLLAANTAGAIAGALGVSLVLIPALGSLATQRLLVALTGAGAVAMFASLVRGPGRLAGRLLAGGVTLAAVGLVTAGLAGTVPPVPGELVALGRDLPIWTGYPRLLYVGEGTNASVAVSQWPEGYRSFHVSGKVEASSRQGDMRTQYLLGHLPALLHGRPVSVLVVGCGAGVTAGSFTVHPDVKHITLCEIEPLIPRVVAGYFTHENHDFLHDPRTVVRYDDARHFVLTTPERFDVITSDPIHPWVKGAAMLYTREYFDLCKQRLNPGGLVVQWVPLYQSDFRTVQSEIATFVEAFPHATLWRNHVGGDNYDLILIGRAEPRKIDVDELELRLRRDDHTEVARDLREVGFDRGMALVSSFAGRGEDLGPWLEGAQINRDRNLRLQYLAGFGVNSIQGDAIYRTIVARRRYPQDLFTASPQRERMLRLAWDWEAGANKPETLLEIPAP